jgi:coniferyl-aldehyde dehydrogenase
MNSSAIGVPDATAGPDDVAAVQTAFSALREAEARDGSIPLARRQALLDTLGSALARRRNDIAAAIDADFGRRSADETLIAEVFVCVEAVKHARKRLHRWARPRPVAVGAPFWPTRARIVPSPLGIVGVIAPWNYPVQLAILPLIGALAAGNRVLVKPSEMTPRTSDLLAALLDEALGPSIVHTVTGDASVAEAVTRLPLDHLLFTGSTATGRRVMAAAASNLTPLTLELGGKCPVLVMPDADVNATARTLVAAKGLNAGQTCLAPDTVLLVGVDPVAFKAALARAARAAFPGGLPTALASSRQQERLHALRTGGEITALTGDDDADGLAIIEPQPDAPAMSEEIFGPLLVLRQEANLHDALASIRRMSAPLAVYLFTKDRAVERRVLDGTRSGALVINGGVTFAALPDLPFGGVGASGMGRYHGEAGFLAFSNMRAHVRSARWSVSQLLDPPYTPRGRALLSRLFRQPPA